MVTISRLPTTLTFDSIAHVRNNSSTCEGFLSMPPDSWNYLCKYAKLLSNISNMPIEQLQQFDIFDSIIWQIYQIVANMPNCWAKIWHLLQVFHLYNIQVDVAGHQHALHHSSFVIVGFDYFLLWLKYSIETACLTSRWFHENVVLAIFYAAC